MTELILAYGRRHWLGVAGLLAVGALLLAVALGASEWLIVLVFAVILGALAGRFGGRAGRGSTRARAMSRAYPAGDFTLVSGPRYVAGVLESRDPDLFFLFSCNAHWEMATRADAEPADGYIGSLVLEYVRRLAGQVCVGSPDDVRVLLGESAPEGIGAGFPGAPDARIVVSDVRVRVDAHTQERWKKIVDWRQRMDVRRAEKVHLQDEVWQGIPEALLWYLAGNPDPAKAASVIGPVEKVLRALGVSAEMPHMADEASVQPGAAVSPAVQLVRSTFPDGTGGRDLFAMSLALLLEHNGDRTSAALLRQTFTTGPVEDHPVAEVS